MAQAYGDDLLRGLRAQESRLQKLRRQLGAEARDGAETVAGRATASEARELLLAETEDLIAAYDALVRVVAQHRTCDGSGACFVAGPQDLGPFARALLSDDGRCMTLSEISSAVGRHVDPGVPVAR